MKFMGLLIYMGLVPLTDIQLYGPKAVCIVFVQKTMYGDCFLLVLQMVHFYDKSKPAVGRDIKIKKLLSMVLKQYHSA